MSVREVRREAPGRARPPGARRPGAVRLVGLDAARGLAIVGMIVINVGPTPATSLLHRLYLLPYGRASVLFVVIAGIGAGLVAARAVRDGRAARDGGAARDGRGDRARTPTSAWGGALWRAAVLGAGGFLLQSLTDDIGVVLPLYAVLFLLVPALVRLPTRGLVGVTAAMLAVGPVLVVLHDVLAWPPVPGNAPVQAGDPPAELLVGFLLAGRYPLVTWVVPFLVGLLLARADLTARSTQQRLVVWGAVAAVGGLVASTLVRVVLGPAADEGFLRLLTGVAHGQMPLWLLSSVGGAAAVVGVALLLGRWRPRWLGPLAAYGRLSLTVYVLHVLVLVLVSPDGLSLAQGVAVSAALVVGTALVPVLWRRVGGPGPLERLVRPPWTSARTVGARRTPVRSSDG